MRLFLFFLTSACCAQVATFNPAIPRVWDEEALRHIDLPLATPSVTPRYPSASYYYSIPELVIYKSYPGRPPAGMSEEQYLDSLRKLDPEIVQIDSAHLHTEQDWIKAGEQVFYAPMSLTTSGATAGRNQWRPWFIRTKGQLEKGPSACASCHVQVRDDGTLIPGAPNGAGTPGQEIVATRSTLQGDELAVRTEVLKRSFATPWLTPDPNARFEIALNLRNGMLARQGTSFLSPQPIPDLIGIKDRRYLDHTGLEQHRSPVDLMRYAALNTNGASIQMLGNYGGFIPGGVNYKTLPDPKTLVRYSDAQLYALVLYIYSLKPPPNQNQPSDLSRRGEEIFRREGCVNCHTPPLYTSNKLTPALGFTIPEEHKKLYDILPVVVGTDPYLTMKTRRGTGYYKVPSLKGVWYRGPFEHNGSVATLEDWLDPHRLRDDYVPTGFKRANPTGAVKGHEFGLKLTEADKKALISFLLTL